MRAGMSFDRTGAWLLAGLKHGAGCAESAPPETLEVLVAQQASFDGQRVRTAGTVREFDSPHHVWIEDAGLNRVELRPAEWLAERVGQQVEVVGRFTFASDVGRRIQLESVVPAATD